MVARRPVAVYWTKVLRRRQDMLASMIPDGYTDIPAGRIAAVVTWLEMRAPAPARPEVESPGWTLTRERQADLAWYRDLFRRVGEEWLWFSRLTMTDAELAAIVHDPRIEVYALWQNGRAEGLLELDFREAGACELVFLGLTPALVGTGAGRWMMNRAIASAWAQPIERFQVHTCTLDHPAAMAFYLRSGFAAIRRQIEIAVDPRLTGLAAITAAPHAPIIR
jgi:GNAT superfamily N-acetyltransferase